MFFLLRSCVTVDTMNVCVVALLTSFLCYAEGNYFLLEELNTAADSRARCQELGYTDLAVVDSQEKSDLVTDLIQQENGVNDVWIGLTFNTTSGNFRWADNSTLGWSNWMTQTGVNEPDLMENGQVCVRINVHKSYQWGTSMCKQQRQALCELIEQSVGGDIFVLHAENLDSANQSLTTIHHIWSKKECSLRCLYHGCDYFLYITKTCVLFANITNLDFSINRPGAVVFRKL